MRSGPAVAERARSSPVRAYVGLGSNLGDRHATLDAAVRALGELASPASTLRCSRRYDSEALQVPERPDERQPDYLNAAVVLDTLLDPHALLDALQAIERAAGRTRIDERRWGARTLDLDLLLYGERCLDDARLRVPHPGIPRRAFVLQPLHDLDARLTVPGQGPIEELLARLPLAMRARPTTSGATCA